MKPELIESTENPPTILSTDYYDEIRSLLLRRKKIAVLPPKGIEIRTFRKRLQTALSIRSFRERTNGFRFPTRIDLDAGSVTILKVAEGEDEKPEYAA